MHTTPSVTYIGQRQGNCCLCLAQVVWQLKVFCSTGSKVICHALMNVFVFFAHACKGGVAFGVLPPADNECGRFGCIIVLLWRSLPHQVCHLAWTVRSCSKDQRRIFITALLILHIKATNSGDEDLIRKLVAAAKWDTHSQKARVCQIYSRSTKKHIQIFNRKVLASGENGSEFAKVELRSTTFGVVTIRGSKTGNYLCVNKKGKPVAKKSLSSDGSCKFREEITPLYWSAFRNEAHPTWYLGFNGKGRSSGKGKKGSRTGKNQPACNFLIRNLEGSFWPPSSPPRGLKYDQLLDIIRGSKKSRAHSRHRRHRHPTADPGEDAHDSYKDEVTLPEWIQPPPVNASTIEKNEWFIRVGNYIKENTSFGQNSTQNVLLYNSFSPTTVTSDPKASKKGDKGKKNKKSRKNSKRSRKRKGGKKRKQTRPKPARPADEATAAPSSAEPSLSSMVVPRTPVRRPKGDSDFVELPTVSSPSRKIPPARNNAGVSNAKDGGDKNTDISNPSVRAEFSNKNLERDDKVLNNKDNFERTKAPSAERVAAGSRRTKSRKAKGEKRRSRKQTDSSKST